MTVEITEFTEVDPESVHLVKRGANGFPVLLAKAAADEVAAAEAGEDLAAKAAGDDSSKDCPTCKGTGKIMDGNRKCPDCDGTGNAPEDAEKAQMSAADQNDLPDSDFAYIEPGGKVEDGKTAPRSLRHFPIQDAAHVRNALARASQSPFGPKAMPAILAAAKKFDIDTSAEKAAGDMVPGDDGIPGSASWETADAARLNEATQSLLDLAALLQTAAAREQIEGQTVDPDDMAQAWTLQDACYMLQNLLGVVAAMAAVEQREADNAPDDEALAQGEATKSGKRLSASTIAALAAARDNLTATLGDDDPSKTDDGDDGAEKSQEDILNMTKDELIQILDERDARKAAAVEEPPVADPADGEEIEAETAEKQEVAAAETSEETAPTETVTKAAFDELVARLAVVEKTAQPGGPTKTRPVAALNKSAERDATELQIAEFERRADASRSDHELRKGYLDKAKELRDQLNAA